MAKRRTDQEWKNLFEEYESSHLSQCVFCERHGPGAPNVYLYREFVDFRKSINGLMMIIESKTIYR